MTDIDPVEFGRVAQAVKNIEHRLDTMEPKVDELVAVKNKGKGYLTALLSFTALIGAGIAEAIKHFFK